MQKQVIIKSKNYFTLPLATETQIHGLEDSFLNYFPTHFEGTGQPSFSKNLPFFSHLTWFMHGNFHETPADWKEILSPLWFGLKERKLVKDAIDWRERE